MSRATEIWYLGMQNMVPGGVDVSWLEMLKWEGEKCYMFW